MSNTGFRFGDWDVDLEGNAVSDGSVRTQLEPRVMQVLRYLCRHPGAVIPAEELLQACWGSNELGDNPVHKAITQLRRALGDSTTDPRYIETIRKRGYRAIATVVEAAEAAPAGWTSGSPFRGLEAFQENHAAIFFGRVSATAQLRAIVTAQAVEGCAMALVLGPSGSGKTSLVRAGLLPQLMAGAARPDEAIVLSSTTYMDCADLGGGNLFQALAAALLDADLDDAPLFDGDSAASLGQRLEKDAAAVASFVGERTGGKPRIAIFVDRLEAIFRSSAADRTAFIAVLETLARGKGLLVVTACRNDFYPDIVALPALMALKARGGHYDLTAPDGADIAQIVRQPARAAQLTFEQDAASGASLDDVLCDAARGSPDTLPLLQYCLNELYRLRSEDGQLRFEAFHQLGGIEGAIGVRAEQVVDGLKPEQVAALPHVLSLLVNIGDEQAAVTARRSPWSLLRSDAERELVRAMVEARLFVSELAGDVPSFGVAHEALLRRWPRVVEWIERYRHALQLRTRLSGQAARWAASSRPRDLLLPSGTQVSQAAELLSLENFSLAPLEAEYVRSSISRARLGERIRNGVVALIAVLAVLATGLGLMAHNAQREAERNRSEAEGLMTYMLGDFSEKLRPIGKLDLLDDISKKALDYLGKVQESDGNVATQTQHAKALRIIGEVKQYRSRAPEAAMAWTKALSILRKLPPNQDRTALRERGIVAFLLGQYHLGQNELDEAEKFLQEYREFSDRFAAVDPTDPDGWLEQSYAHNSLGVIAMKRNRFDEAAREFEQALKGRLQVQRQKPEKLALQADLANSYSWLAESKLKQGHLDETMRLYGEEEALLRPIFTGDANWANRLSLSLMRQGLLQAALGHRAEAMAKLKDAEGVLQRLVDLDPSNRQWQARLYAAKGRQFELFEPNGDPKSSLDRLQVICEKMEGLSALDPKNSTLTFQTIKFKQARTPLLQMLGRHADALKNLDDAVAALEAQYLKSKTDSAAVSIYADALLARADIAHRSGLDERMIDYCKQARDVLLPLASTSTDYALLALQVRANICIGDSNLVANQMRQLDTMGYREARYMRYISTQPFMKGNQ
ncbi:winged helix-turn-helix domain-containing protein [Pseudoduganella sp. RAF19]|uniref:nSTAND1 domain-containing NTPase n=1 Tax=Pseudoduganella sp. RAF19 TaxID=3233052 RepID=UPI003F9C3D85